MYADEISNKMKRIGYQKRGTKKELDIYKNESGTKKRDT